MGGQCILPAAAMFEAAIAALSTASTAAASATLLTAVAIAAPLALTSRGDALLDITFAPAMGSLTTHSLNLLTAERQLHLRASAACCSPQTTQRRTQGPAGGTEAAQPVVTPWQAAVLREAAAEMRRYDGGTLAALDVAWERDGSGYLTHPAVADSCLHTGAVFTAPPAPSQDGTVSGACACTPSTPCCSMHAIS